jgi:hypothetical protein
MTRQRLLLTLYLIPLLIFFAVIIFATLLDIIGVCTYKSGVMETCQIGASNVADLYNTNVFFIIFSNTSFFFFWILLGGCTLYIRDWLNKRNA